MLKLSLALVALAACSVTDDRPETLAYITETILAPNCATAECHSATKREFGYMFDSVDHTQQSIKDGNLIAVCDMPPCDTAPANSDLLTVITTKDSYGNRMPLDEPLPDLDAVLIAKWITDGANGYTP